jgi:hypothetical protein
MPRRANSTSVSASSTVGIGRCVIARIAKRPPSHWIALSMSMSARTWPRLIARSSVTRETSSRRSVDSRCRAAIRDRRTQEGGAVPGVHEGQDGAVALGEVPADVPGVGLGHLHVVEGLHRRDSEVLLGRPAAVDRRLPDAGARRHVVHGGAVEPALKQELGGGGGDPLVGLRVAGSAASSTYRGLSRRRGTEGVWCLAHSHASDPSRNSDTGQRNAYGY